MKNRDSSGQTNNSRQAAWIAIGSLFSFGFSIVSSMILSRYFDKADYGTYKQVLYVYHTMLSVFTLGLPKAFSYFLPRVKPSQAKSLIRKITNLFFLLGGFFTILLFVGAPFIAEWMNNPDLTLALRVFSIVPVLMLPTMGLEGILATYQKTRLMAVYTIVTRIMMLLFVALPVVLFSVGYIESIIGFVIASFISFVLALYLKYYPVPKYENENTSISYRNIFDFSLPIFYASLWGAIIHSADQFFISRYYGSAIFAEFANGSTELPFIGMILGACSAVLSPIFSRMSHEQMDPQKDIFPLWKSVFEKTVKLIYPIILYCWFFADVVMVLLYGEDYRVSSIYFQIKLVSYLFTLIIYAPLVINIGKVKYYAGVHMWSAILLILLEYLCAVFIDSPYAISIVSLLCLVGRTFALLWVVAHFFQLRLDQLFPLRLIAKIVIPSVLFLYIERIVVLQWSYNSLYMFFISFLCYVISYFLYSTIIHIDYFSIIKPLINRR